MKGGDVDPPAKRADARRDAAKETGRIEAFSDGVFAIAITLLVLNLHVPEVVSATDSDLVPSLLNQWPTYVAFVLSFVTILIMWVNHHALFNYIHHTDHVFLMLNGLLLLGITAFPFPTAILAQYFDRPGQHVAADVYSATFMLIAVAFNVVWRYAAHDNRLLHPHFDVQKIAAQSSAAPGPGGVPIRQQIEVRQVMGAPEPEV